MGNNKIIESALQKIDAARIALTAWAVMPEVTFEEQKTVAEMLSQALSAVWLVPATSLPTKDATQSLEKIKQINLHRDALLNTLADLRKELDKVLPTGEKSKAAPAAESAEPAKQEPSRRLQPRTGAASKEPSTAIVDMFAVHSVDDPAMLTPLDKLFGSIGLSDRFMFIKELFNNNADMFVNTIKHLDTLNSLEEAHAYMNQLLPHINRNDTFARQFENLLVRRFMNRQPGEAKK